MSLKLKSFLLSITFIPLAFTGQFIGEKLSVYTCNLLVIPGVIYIASFLSGIMGGVFSGLVMRRIKEFDKKILNIVPILFLALTVLYFGFSAYKKGTLELIQIIQNLITVRIFIIMTGEGVITRG